MVVMSIWCWERESPWVDHLECMSESMPCVIAVGPHARMCEWGVPIVISNETTTSNSKDRSFPRHVTELIHVQKDVPQTNSKDLSHLWWLRWHASKHKVHKLHQRYLLTALWSGEDTNIEKVQFTGYTHKNDLSRFKGVRGLAQVGGDVVLHLCSSWARWVTLSNKGRLPTRLLWVLLVLLAFQWWHREAQQVLQTSPEFPNILLRCLERQLVRGKNTSLTVILLSCLSFTCVLLWHWRWSCTVTLSVLKNPCWVQKNPQWKKDSPEEKKDHPEKRPPWKRPSYKRPPWKKYHPEKIQTWKKKKDNPEKDHPIKDHPEKLPPWKTITLKQKNEKRAPWKRPP